MSINSTNVSLNMKIPLKLPSECHLFPFQEKHTTCDSKDAREYCSDNGLRDGKLINKYINNRTVSIKQYNPTLHTYLFHYFKDIGGNYNSAISFRQAMENHAIISPLTLPGFHFPDACMCL